MLIAFFFVFQVVKHFVIFVYYCRNIQLDFLFNNLWYWLNFFAQFYHISKNLKREIYHSYTHTPLYPLPHAAFRWCRFSLGTFYPPSPCQASTGEKFSMCVLLCTQTCPRLTGWPITNHYPLLPLKDSPANRRTDPLTVPNYVTPSFTSLFHFIEPL